MNKEGHWEDAIASCRPFSRADVEPLPLKPLHRKRWGQARVFRVTINQQPWVIKDFSRNRVARFLWGRWLLARELRALKCLEKVPGVPKSPFQLDRDAIAYRFVSGETLRQLRSQRAAVADDFFPQLENTVQRMHDAGVAHLDLGNLRNILNNQGQPRLIDFGSSLFLDGLPRPLAQRARQIDRSRLYKCWAQLSPKTLGPERASFLAQHYHKHHFKPKHWGSQMLTAMRQSFHNPSLRRWFRKSRVVLGILFLIVVMSQIKAAWYWPGAIIATVGALLQAWCFACIDTQTTLADRGPYSLVRNPQYLTRFLLVLGVVLMTGNPWLIAGTTVLYYFYAVTRVEREEALLPEALGEPYRDYCQRVPRFLPRLGNLDSERLWHWNPAAFRKNHGRTNLVTVFAALAMLYVWAFVLG